MLYLKRKIDRFLEDWREEPDRTPLIVKGPRQVGKTESIRRFGNRNYKSVICINFVDEPKYKTITADGYKAEAIIKNISRIDPSKRFIEGQTLIFFDELQEFPDIDTALNFLRLDDRFDVICSGSMPGIDYQNIQSDRIGCRSDYKMSSLDFEEFLWAKGFGDTFIDEMLEHMRTLTPFNEAEMSVCSELFLDYCILGGMPAVVREFISRGTFEGSLKVQRQLIAAYKEEIRKYAKGTDQARILNVFNHIPSQLAKDNKKFQISKVASGARFRDYRRCIEWLHDAGMVNICYCLNFPELPLQDNYDDAKCKIYIADSGLLVAMLNKEAQEDLRTNKNLGIHKGALYENAVGEALVKAGYKLYYYKRDGSSLEQDFFVRAADTLIPVEVKAKNGTAKSMKTLIGSDKYPDIRRGIKFIGENIGYRDNIYTFPYFCAFLLKRYLTGTGIEAGVPDT